jgi:hypothetical protein
MPYAQDLVSALKRQQQFADVTSGMIEPGNIQLKGRPQVKNADGSISTVRSIGVNIDGREMLIPTVVNGRVVSNDDAIKNYKDTGQHLGIFKDPAASTRYAIDLHNKEAKKIK